jgi:hypothetical protein
MGSPVDVGSRDGRGHAASTTPVDGPYERLAPGHVVATAEVRISDVTDGDG